MYTINTQIELNSLQVVEIKIIELLFYFIVYLCFHFLPMPLLPVSVTSRGHTESLQL